MRQERLYRCDPTMGSVLSPEFSGVPVGTHWGQIKVYWGLMGVEGPCHRLLGAETRAVPRPLCVLQVQQSFSCLSHSVAWAGVECPEGCRDPWDQSRALQRCCSWCHTRDVHVLGTRSTAFPAAAKE